MARSVPVRQFPSFQQQRVENNKGSDNHNPREPNRHHLAGLKNAIKAVQIALLELEAQLSILDDYQELITTQSVSNRESLPNLAPSAHSTQIRIYCFGRFQVFLGDEAVQLNYSGKGCLLLKYLVAAIPRPVHKDVLLETLWPDTSPEVANNRLKVIIHNIRQEFSSNDLGMESAIVYNNSCYSFNPDLPIWVDISAFEECLHHAARLEHSGQLDGAISLYQETEALYRGDFLEEDRFEEWAILRREELKDDFLNGLESSGMCWSKTGHPDRAIEAWKKILRLDPWREDIYRHLMIMEMSTGNRAAALHWYYRCKEMLEEQFNIVPEPETSTLYARICSGVDFAIDNNS